MGIRGSGVRGGKCMGVPVTHFVYYMNPRVVIGKVMKLQEKFRTRKSYETSEISLLSFSVSEAHFSPRI